jgi:SAM-dependent methyltransferase
MSDEPRNELSAPSLHATPAAHLADGAASADADTTETPDEPAGAGPSYYLLEHTTAESARQKGQHEMFYGALGNHHLVAMPAAPLPAHAWILDAGCGDGYWLRDVLREWPQAIGVGVDLSVPTAPTEAFLPPTRAIFVTGNLVTGLPFADGVFYLVHQRMLGAALPRGRWPTVLAELARVTAPGGWLECLEAGPVEDIPASCPAVRRLQDFTDALGAERDIDLALNARVGDLLGATPGLDAASCHVYNIPLVLRLTPTPTPGWVGDPMQLLSALAARNWLEARRTLAPQIIAHGWADAEQHERLLLQAERELSEHAVHWPIHVAYARRTATAWSSHQPPAPQ